MLKAKQRGLTEALFQSTKIKLIFTNIEEDAIAEERWAALRERLSSLEITLPSIPELCSIATSTLILFNNKPML